LTAEKRISLSYQKHFLLTLHERRQKDFERKGQINSDEILSINFGYHRRHQQD